jgi:hypothetical protein
MNRILPSGWAGVGAKKTGLSLASVEDASKKKKLVVFAAVCLAEKHRLKDGMRHWYVYLQNWGRRSTAMTQALRAQSGDVSRSSFKPGTYQTGSFAELTPKFQTCGTLSRKFRAPSPTPND